MMHTAEPTLPDLRVAQLTDTHLTPEADWPTVLELFADRPIGDPHGHLEDVVADLGSLDRRPDLVIGTGDLADTGEPEAYRRWRDVVGALGVPIQVLAGNHDLPDSFAAHLVGGAVSAPRTAEIGTWLLLYVPTGNTEWGEVPAQAIHDLGEQLAASTADHVLVLVHHPPVGQHLAAHETLVRTGLAAILGDDDRVRAIACGHVHHEAVHDLDGVPVYCTPSTYLGRPGPGYRLLDLADDGSVTTHVRTIESRFTIDEVTRERLMAVAAERYAAHPEAVPGHDESSRAEVVAWGEQAGRSRLRR